MIFKRKIYNELLKWKQEDDGKTAILIKGARRVGKSTIAEEFARNEYETYMLIDFAECSDEVRNLFNDVSNLDFIFLRLQMIYGTELKVRKSTIIFDEVQQAPKARQAIKYLVKDHRYDYMETGSLISIRKNIKDIVIPSEEVKVEMYPMDYEEFKWALGDTVSVPLLAKCFARKEISWGCRQQVAHARFPIIYACRGNAAVRCNLFGNKQHGKGGQGKTCHHQPL